MNSRRDLLIVRHADRRGEQLTDTGIGETHAVLRRLKETLDELPTNEKPRAWSVIAAGSGEARQTADLVTAALGAGPSRHDAHLRPSSWSPFGGEESLETLRALGEELTARHPDRANGVVVVLHEPQAAWLTKRLSGRDISLEKSGLVWLVPTREKRHGHRWAAWETSLEKSGLSWLVPAGRRLFGHRWAVWTTIEPGEEDALESVVKKVEVKYRTAGALGGFLTALVTFLGKAFSERIDDARALETGLWAGALGLIGLGAVLSFAALFEYDRLQMPTRYWGPGLPKDRPVVAGRHSRVVARPPANAARLVVESSQRVWNRLIVPSFGLLALGLVLFAGAIAGPEGPGDLWGILVAALLLGIGTFAWFLARAPLGTSD